MLDDWFTTIKLPLSGRQFHQLPQNPAYKYEYLDKTAWLSPRPKFSSVRLSLGHETRRHLGKSTIKSRLAFAGWETRLAPTLAPFRRGVPPGPAVREPERSAPARGGACLLEADPLRTRWTHDRTCLPRGLRHGARTSRGCDPRDVDPDDRPRRVLELSMEITTTAGLRRAAARQAAPDLDLRRPMARPPRYWLRTPGSRIRSLLELGYTELISSFILGNTSSMLWHWRSGFELLPYMGSLQAFRSRLKKADSKAEGTT